MGSSLCLLSRGWNWFRVEMNLMRYSVVMFCCRILWVNLKLIVVNLFMFIGYVCFYRKVFVVFLVGMVELE